MSPTPPRSVPRVPDRQSRPAPSSPGRSGPRKPCPSQAQPPQPPTPLAALTDLTDIHTIFAPEHRTTTLQTIHIKYDRTVPPPDRPFLPHPSTVLNPASIAPIVRGLFARHDDNQEHFIILTCNPQTRPYGYKLITSGTRSDLLVDPALVFTAALLLSAHGIIVMHNHPSCAPFPSTDDLDLTQRLILGGLIINIPVLDHIILARSGHCLSLREHHPDLWTGSPA